VLLEGALRFLQQHTLKLERAVLEARLCAAEAVPGVNENDVEDWQRLYDSRRRELSTP
jgi:hypothetical protein